jgi:hypothetical protein
MPRKIAGILGNTKSHLLASMLLLSFALGGCSLFKKADSGPDAQASAIPSVSAIVPELPSAPQIASVAVAPSATHTHTQVAVATSAKTAASGAPGATAASAASTQPAAAAIPAASALASAIPVVNTQCQAACQKGYHDCANQAGAVTGLELVRKCRAVLMPCLTACK